MELLMINIDRVFFWGGREELHHGGGGSAKHTAAPSPLRFPPHGLKKNSVHTAVLWNPQWGWGPGGEGRAQAERCGWSGSRSSPGIPLPTPPTCRGQPASRAGKTRPHAALALPGLARFHAAGWQGWQPWAERFPKEEPLFPADPDLQRQMGNQ